MSSFKRFEEIVAWQKAKALDEHLHKFIEKNSAFAKDYVLRNQVERSAGSIMDNIAEGFGRMGNGEFAHFLTISIGSAREFQSQLYRVINKKYIDQEEFDLLFALSEEICKMLLSLIFKLKATNITGLKFKGSK